MTESSALFRNWPSLYSCHFYCFLGMTAFLTQLQVRRCAKKKASNFSFAQNEERALRGRKWPDLTGSWNSVSGSLCRGGISFLCGLTYQLICRKNYKMQIFMNHCICCNFISKTNIALYCGSCVLWVERFSSIYPILSNKLQGINAASQTGMQCLLEHLCSWQVVVSLQQVFVKLFKLALKLGIFWYLTYI